MFRLWKAADLDRIEAGLKAAGVPIRQSKLALQQAHPKKWRQYLLGRRKQNRAEVQRLYKSKITLAEEMLRALVAAHADEQRPVTFDNWYRQPAFCRFIDKTLGLPETLASDETVVLTWGEERLDAFAHRLKQEHEKPIKVNQGPVFRKITIYYKGEPETYYSYCRSHRTRGYGKQRLGINPRKADLCDKPVFYISNRLQWQARGITRIRRHRWPVEVYHEEGKAEGLAQYQLRDFGAIYRHIALVAVV